MKEIIIKQQQRYNDEKSTYTPDGTEFIYAKQIDFVQNDKLDALKIKQLLNHNQIPSHKLKWNKYLQFTYRQFKFKTISLSWKTEQQKKKKKTERK